MKRLAFTLVLVLASACAQAHKKKDSTVQSEKLPFDIARAPAELGFATMHVAKTERLPDFPDLFLVSLENGNPSDHKSFYAIAHDHRLERGYAATGRYLKRIHIYDRAVEAYRLLHVLAGLGAMPPDIGASVDFTDPQTGEKSSFTKKPFVLKVVTDRFQLIPEQIPGGPPADSPQPMGGPAGAPGPGAPPGAPGPAGPGPGPGGPGPGGPGGAVSPATPGRSILRGDDDYRFVWTVESWDRSTHAWRTEKTIALE